MAKKKRKPTPKWKQELHNFLYYTKRERDGMMILQICMMGYIANRLGLRMQFAIFMLIVTPIIFLICSIFIYRQKKKDIERIKNYVDDEDTWEDDGLPF